MLKKYLFFFIYCIYSVFSLSTFIEKDERAELFKLTDNEVAAFKVSLPEDEFALLKESASYNQLLNMTAQDPMAIAKSTIETLFMLIKLIDFNLNYPTYNLTEMLPELKINEQGYAQIDENEILKGYDFEKEHYSEEDLVNPDLLFFAVAKKNTEFDLLKVIKTISNMEIAEDSPNKPMLEMIFAGFKQIEFTNLVKRGITDNVEANGMPQFKTKNATLTVEINGEKKSFNKITFKLAGQSTRSYSKVPFNLKIRGGKSLYGRSQFKLRPDCSEPTILRTKLVSDIHNRLGLKSISTNYITLYINDEYMGLYTLNDAYKLSWVEQVYGEKETTSLYQCKSLYDFDPNYSFGCFNENEDVSDYQELSQFLETVKNAKSPSDLEDVFDIDHFLTEMAIEYLLGSWDHIQNPLVNHNFYLYKQPNGKWVYLSYDFDMDFGHPLRPYDTPMNEFTKDNNLIRVLILNDSTRFDDILKKVVEKVFNPATLYPHIDELKAFIEPYVKLDKTPDSNGNYPGRINTQATDDISYEQWEANIEYTSINTNLGNNYGLKFWTLIKYRYVCDYYDMECDPVYMDENYKYSVNTDVGTAEDYIYVRVTKTATSTVIETEVPTTTVIETEVPTTTVIETEVPTTTIIETEVPTTTVIETESTTIVAPPTPTPTPTNQIKCWSELEGYPCCSPGIKKVYAQDEYGDWGYDFSKNVWCGLTAIDERVDEEECWSEEYGYPCCKGCKVYEEDYLGSWGYESNHWCGISSYCKK